VTDVTAGDALCGRAVTNTLAQFIAPAARAVAGIVLVAVLGRYLGVTGFGEYGLVIAYVLLPTNVLAEWGLATILVREVSRRPAERAALIASAAALQLVLAAASYLAILAVAALVPYPDAVRVSLAVFGLTLFFAPVQMLTAHFQADLRLARLVAPAVAGTVAQFLLVIVAVAVQGPLVAIVAAGLVGVALEQSWTALLVLRELPLPRPARRAWGPFLAEAWPLATSTLIATAASRSPAIVLSAFSLDAVGIFAAAEKIPNYLTRAPYALRATMFPLLSRDGSPSLLRAAVGGSLLIGAPLAIAGAGLAREICVLVYGPAFADAALPFALLMIAFALFALGLMLEAAFVAQGRQRLNLAIRTAAATLLLVLVLALAPSSGAAGSAAAVLASAATAVVLSLVLLLRRTGAA
jgi:O-antigen/teichoic acid export membrane protein